MTKVISSSMSGPLEIFYYRGKKMLGTKNTSYSYGPVQSVWLDVMRRVKPSHNRSTLILGMGAGNILKLVRSKWKYRGLVVGVEIDPVIIEIAQKEFGIRASRITRIVQADAFQYVQQQKEQFDCQFIDVFIDNKLPGQTLTLKFWKSIRRAMNPGGLVLFNIYNQEQKLSKIQALLNSCGLSARVLKNMGKSNIVLVIR